MSPGRMIYIVESDESVGQGLFRLLESAGFEAQLCGSVEDLMLRAGQDGAGCALLDLATQDLRKPALRSRLLALTAVMPVIALSVRDDKVVRQLAREVGARAFFRQPVDSAALLDSIDWLIRTESSDRAP